MTTEPKNENTKITKLLSGEELLGIGELKRVEVEPLGGYVWMRRLSAGAILELLALDEEKRSEHTLALIAQAVVDEGGRPLFGRDKAEKLREVRMDVYNILSNAITEDFTGTKAEEGGEPGNVSGETVAEPAG